MFKRILCLLPIIIILAGCSGGEGEHDEGAGLTEDQRDSVLAESDLPGAGVVGKAIEVSDSASVRSKKIDDLSR